ncbi:hypothetical protein Leryth_011853 [Lithospermum erythrorhizon]|nr:hypothetical protein Leryth_011853 [Lithospermum erythrorhizon]
MSENIEQAAESPPPSGDRDGGASVRARPDLFLIVCNCFSLVTSLAAICCIIVNVLSVVRSFKNGSDVFDGVFRCYAVVIAVFVVLAETEWTVITQFWKVLIFLLSTHNYSRCQCVLE